LVGVEVDQAQCERAAAAASRLDVQPKDQRVEGRIIPGRGGYLDDLREPRVCDRTAGGRWSAWLVDLLGGVGGGGDQAVFFGASVEAAQRGDHAFGRTVAAAAAAADDNSDRMSTMNCRISEGVGSSMRRSPQCLSIRFQ
jgi:hypothetical protein